MIQLTRDDLKTMSPQQITQAQAAGQLAQLLGAPKEHIDLINRATEGKQLTRADLTELLRIHRHDLIPTTTIKEEN